MTIVVTSPWFISHHAMVRMQEMGLTRSDVVCVLDDPETDYPATKRHRPGMRVATRDNLAVIYNPGDRSICTVLWRSRSSREEGPRVTGPKDS